MYLVFDSSGRLDAKSTTKTTSLELSHDGYYFLEFAIAPGACVSIEVVQTVNVVMFRIRVLVSAMRIFGFWAVAFYTTK